MDWKPISEADIWDKLNSSWERMSIPQRNFWETIRIDPEKWQQHPYGDEGGGFWAVGLIGRMVLWYNDIEEGFNRSRYSTYGEIGAYWCNQDELEWVVQHIMHEVEDGRPSGPYMGPPEPIA